MRKLLLALSSVFLCTNAFSWVEVGTELAKSYNYNENIKFSQNELPYIIAGNIGTQTQGINAHSYGLVAIIAYDKLTNDGAFLCPIQIQCMRESIYCYTRYFVPAGIDKNNFTTTNCLYLCKDGYTYSEATKSCVPAATSAFNCDHRDPEAVFKTSNPTMTTTTTKNIENSLKLFGTAIDDKNEYGQKPERDLLLAVKEFIPHGVKVRPYALRCNTNKKGYNYIDRFFLRANSDTLLCMPGYKPNAAKTACELIDANKCDVTALAKCNTNDNRTFDSATHKWIVGPNGNCRIQVCADNTKAFESDVSTNCIPCGDGTKAYGINTYGVCVKCSAGELFSDKTFKCETGVRLSKTDMLYGRGKTKTTADAQCWQILDAGIYRQCITTACEVGKKWTTDGCVEIKTTKEEYTITFNNNTGNGDYCTMDSGGKITVTYNGTMPTIDVPTLAQDAETCKFLGYYYQGVQYYNSAGKPVRKYDKKQNITLDVKYEYNGTK